MNFRVAAAGLLCLLTACHVPTPGTGSSPARTDDLASARSALARAPMPDLAPRAPQYSPHEMFMNEHGEFILAREAWRPNVLVSHDYMADAEVKNQRGTFDLGKISTSVEGNIYVDPNSFLHLGVDGSQRDYQFDNIRDGAGLPRGAHDNVLYKGAITIGFGHFIDPDGDMLLEANFRPGVYSDFNGTLHHNDWQFYADALLTMRFDENIYLKGGIEHSGLFRDLDAFPVIGGSLILDETFRVDVLLPKHASVTANLSPASSINVSLDLRGDEYRIRHPQNNSGTARSINVQELELSVGGFHRLGDNLKGLSVHGRIGTTLLGDYYWRDNTTSIYDGTLEPQLFAEIAFGWEF